MRKYDAMPDAAWTPEQWEAAIKIWEHAALSVLDIRHRLVRPDEEPTAYVLPASALLLIMNGPCAIQLEHRCLHTGHFALLHLPKGTRLVLHTSQTWISYYLILYKAAFNAACFLPGHSAEVGNPLQIPCALHVQRPLLYADVCANMHDRWQRIGTQRQLHAKAGLYQFIRQVTIDLEEQQLHDLPTDYVRSVVNHINRHYHQPLTISGMAETLGISGSQLNRLFKQQLAINPQDYLTEIRMQAARYYLQSYPVSLKEVAAATGIYDEFYLSRLLKRRYGMNVSQLKQNFTKQKHDLYMASGKFSPYTVECIDNNYHYQKEGEDDMLTALKNKLLLGSAISLMLVASACSPTADNSASSNSPATSGNGTAATSNTASSGNAAAATQSATEENTPATSATRTISTEMGDVEIPVAPERIVAPFIQGDLLALGIKPVGTSFNDGAIFEEELREVALGIPWEVDLEAIMALEPDLIIYNVADEYEKLRQIAPTVLISDLYSNTEMDRIVRIGELVGRKEKAEELYAGLLASIAENRAKLEAAGLQEHTVLLMEYHEQRGIVVFGNNYGRGGELLYNHFGMKAPQRVQADIIDHPDDPKLLDLSLEVIAQYQGDYIMASEGAIVNLSGNAIWEGLTAVKENRVIPFDSDKFWFNDILSLQDQVDYLAEQLLQAPAP